MSDDSLGPLPSGEGQDKAVPAVAVPDPPRHFLKPIDVKVPGREKDRQPYNLRPRPKHTRKLRFGMNYAGKFVYTDINNLPPLELDDEGYAMPPPPVSRKRRRCFTVIERQVRFLLMWNYSGGNKTLACQEAGVTRQIADAWLSEPLFKAKIKEMEDEIIDRAHFRLMQTMGLVRRPKELKIHDRALFGFIHKNKPEMFAEGIGTGGDGGDTEATETGIPRPAGPA